MATGTTAVAQPNMMSALTGKRDLTPESLIRSFAGFAFELNEQRQDAETFLQRQRGDCDDFASLASRLLTARGYKTKLVVVMMAQQTHVVCYVPEAHGFLDFNHRADTQPVIKSDGTLEDIAQKVAGDFRSRWQLASVFRYTNGLPVYLDNVFPSDPTLVKVDLSSTNTKVAATNELASTPLLSSAAVDSTAKTRSGDYRLP